MIKILMAAFILFALIACKQTPIQNTNTLRHVVLFEWTDSIAPEKKAELITHFASLRNKIDVIQDFEYGTDVSVEGLSKGYTHCFIVTFNSEADRDIYLPHPDHKTFGDSVVPYLKNVLVVDYNSGK